MLSLLFLHLILIVLNRFDVEFRDLLILTLFRVTESLPGDARENIGVILAQMLL